MLRVSTSFEKINFDDDDDDNNNKITDKYFFKLSFQNCPVYSKYIH